MKIKNFKGLHSSRKNEEDELRIFEFYAEGLRINNKGEIVLKEVNSAKSKSKIKKA